MEGHLLIVDDERNILEALKRALSDEPFEVVTAPGGAEGLALLETHPIKVVISDERMPGMSGADFLQLVRDRFPETVRIMLTGHASLEAAMRAVNYGDIYRFLTKPWNDLELIQTIRAAVEKHDMEMENQRLLRTVKRQASELNSIEERFPGITRLERDEQGFIVVEEASRQELSEILKEFEGAPGKNVS